MASLAAYGCSSSSSGNGTTPPPTDGGTTDSPTTGACTNLAGATDITVTVVEYGTPTSTPLANASVRAEVPGKNTCFVDAKTDATGVAHLKVDLTKSPTGAVDVTAAIAGHNVVSILGVKAPIAGNVVLFQTGMSMSTMQFKATGAIKNTKAATNKLQIDAWDWVTVVTAASSTSYSTNFDVAPAKPIPMPVSAIEVDQTTMNAPKAVQAIITAPTQRTLANMTIDIDFSQSPMMPTSSTVKMNWPTTGAFTAAQIKGAGAPVQDMHIGSGIVEKLTADEAAAAMFCGIAYVDAMDNTTLHLQTFGGAMSPDIAGTEVTTLMGTGTPMNTDYAAVVYAHDLTGSPSVSPGPLNKVNIGGKNLGDATFEVDSDGYDSAEVVVSAKQGMTSTTLWIVYAPGGKVASRQLPNLPGGVALSDIGDTSGGASMFGQVVKYVNKGSTPWEAITQDQSYLMLQFDTQLDGAFR
jgi:hypothetical protein